MFDVGFSELLMIALVALVVIGPERLPGVARNVGKFVGRLQRYVHDVKRDFNREVEFEEIKRLQQEMEHTVQSMQVSMRAVESTLQQELQIQKTGEAEVPTPVSEAQMPHTQNTVLAQPVMASLPTADAGVVSKETPHDDQLRLF